LFLEAQKHEPEKGRGAVTRRRRELLYMVTSSVTIDIKTQKPKKKEKEGELRICLTGANLQHFKEGTAKNEHENRYKERGGNRGEYSVLGKNGAVTKLPVRTFSKKG